MKNPIVSNSFPVTLIGGAHCGIDELNISINKAPFLAAADGGADHALAGGQPLAAVIGDLDSLSDAARIAYADRLFYVDEPDTTDFEKLLTRVDAPLYLGCGFLGGRLDHTLAVLNVMVRYPEKRVVLLSADDVVFVAPHDLSLAIPVGTRIGFLPMGDVGATSTGLRWALDGVDLHPARFVGSSNEAAQANVRVATRGPLIVTLPLAQLDAAIAAVRAG